MIVPESISSSQPDAIESSLARTHRIGPCRGQSWWVWGPFVLGAAGVVLVVAVQRHLGLLLTTQASIDVLIAAGSIGFMTGLVMAAMSQCEASRVADGTGSASATRLSAIARRAGVRSAYPIASALAAFGLYHLIPHYEEPAYQAFMRWLNAIVIVVVIGAFPCHLIGLIRERKVSGSASIRASSVELLLARCLQAVRLRSLRPLVRVLRLRRIKSVVLAIPVRFFFVPLMFSSLMGLRMHLLVQIALGDGQYVGAAFFFKWLLPLVSTTIFFLDVLIATTAYLIESRWLGNRIRSVDRSISGWLVCLICYYPFHHYFDRILPESPPSGPNWAASTLGEQWLLVALVIVQFLWLLPSVCLGLRASNLTHRGIVSFGPYRWVRHPQYAFQMLVLILLLLPQIDRLGANVAVGGMIAIYALRCVTEERHLRHDPIYRAYCDRTRYRVIPGVW